MFMESFVQNRKAREANGLATASGGGQKGNKLRKREILQKMDMEVSQPNSTPTSSTVTNFAKAITNT